MKTWLITGCSSGLGLGIAKAVLRRGDWAAITARDPAALDTLAQAYPEQALPLRLDLGDQGSMEAAVRETIQHFGSIDILVNNAGHGYRAAIEESGSKAVEELFQTNFNELYERCCHHRAEHHGRQRPVPPAREALPHRGVRQAPDPVPLYQRRPPVCHRVRLPALSPGQSGGPRDVRRDREGRARGP